MSPPANAPASPEQKKSGLRVIIPSDFNYLAGIDETAAKHNLSKLRETELPDDDLEVRISVSSRFGIDLLVLSRIAGHWQAKHFLFLLCKADKNVTVNGEMLEAPKSGWEPTWDSLRAAGLLSLSGVRDALYNDGYSYVVETNVNKTYLLYNFVNPQRLKETDGKQMVEIGDIIANEFGLKTFKRDFSCDR